MAFRPSPKQSLFLWKMITAETPELREPRKSDARPELDATKERKPLIDHGFLETEKRGRADHLVLTDRAWAWAAERADVELLKSRSPDGAIALQGLLRRLIPLLLQRGIALAELFAESTVADHASSAKNNGAGAAVAVAEHATNRPRTRVATRDQLTKVVLDACRELVGGQTSQPLRLASLRARLSEVPTEALDSALHELHGANRIALYRDDNAARVTDEDEGAALMVGDAPRHILYLKA